MARSATMLLPLVWRKGLPGTGQAGDQRLDCTAMIAAGRIDDGIGRPSLGLQQRRIIERADDWFDAVGGNRVGLGLVANEAANLMAVRDQGRCNRAPDISRSRR